MWTILIFRHISRVPAFSGIVFGSADFVVVVVEFTLIRIVMGIRPSKYKEFDSEDREIKRLIKDKGIAGAQDLMQQKGEGQKSIKIGVAGVAGVGKSSFINAIRGYVNIFHGLLFHQI
jgi:putative ribosome biogenesis GTPase RsgA